MKRFIQRFVPMYHGFLNKIRVAFGHSIVIDDASDEALVGLRVFGKSTQNGTPTPDYPVEIVSVENPNVMLGGKNLLDLDETLTFTHVVSLSTHIPAGTYVLSFESETHGGANQPQFRFYDNKIWHELNAENNSTIVTLEIPETKIYIYSNGTSTANSVDVDATINKLMLSTVEGEYESHKETQSLSILHTLRGIPVTSGGNYTDANGQQWICDEVDFKHDVYIQRIVKLESYDGESIKTPYISTTGALTVGATILYSLEIPIATRLTADQIAAYKALHTNEPNTTIYNDQDAWMEVSYITK